MGCLVLLSVFVEQVDDFETLVFVVADKDLHREAGA